MFTLLNIAGLAIGISACWIIYRIVDFEFSYDKQIPAKESVYRLVSGFVFDEKESWNGGVSKPVYLGIRHNIPAVDIAAPLYGEWIKAVEVARSEGKPQVYEDQEDIAATDSTYFTIIPYKWLAGNKTVSLLSPGSVVLTESRARQYFPGKTPQEIMGRQLTYFSRDTVARTVTGVVADMPVPTEFVTKEFLSMRSKPYELAEWTNTNGSDKIYLKLKTGADPLVITRQIEKIADQKKAEFEKQQANSFKYRRWYQLLPLSQSHFSTYINEYGTRKASKPVLYSLMGIALFLLLLACINYINMSMAAIPQRTREIGVRKTLGSSRWQLIRHFLLETMFTAILAGIVSFFISKSGFFLLKDIIPQGVDLINNPLQLVAFILALALVVTLLAGLYPGWLITRVQAISIFRSGSAHKKTNGFSLQKTLIVFQFIIAIVFITGALIVSKQLRYLLYTNMGFNREAVVLADVPWKLANNKAYENKQFSLYNELKKIPGMEVSLGGAPMSDNYSSSEYRYTEAGKEPVKRQVFRKQIDTGYINFYGMQLLAGRNLRASDTLNEFVINETAVRAFGFKSAGDALGKMIGPSDAQFPVVGVVKDFHQQNFYQAIDPMAFESEKSRLLNFNIRLPANHSQWQKIIKQLEKQWYLIYPPESFKYTFYDDMIAGMYKQEQNLAKLVQVATVISIIISCLGLFGLAVLTAFQRTKEIGIRKVLGATIASIVSLLSREYVYLIAIAFAIATPLTIWAAGKWLQNFAYRVQPNWWTFALAGLIAIVLALITVSYQAIKAAIANPVKSLRSE